VPNPSPVGPPPVMPASARVAVGVMAVLALLLLSNGALLWFGYDAAVDRIAEEADVSRAEAERFVLLSLVPYLVLGVVLLVAAIAVARRQGWARWVGVAATGLLAVMTVLSVLATGRATAPSLLLLVLSIAGLTSLLAGTTRAWLGADRPA
jgi:hypothetical protein